MAHIEKKIEEQKELFFEMVQKSGINIVTCGSCGEVVLHRVNDTEIQCPACGFKSEPCDFPDFYY